MNPDTVREEKAVPSPAEPTVIKVGTFNTKETPYDIEVDTAELGRIMRKYFHLPESEIGKLDILMLSGDMPWRETAVSELTKEQIRTMEERGSTVLGLAQRYEQNGRRIIGIHTGNIFDTQYKYLHELIDMYFRNPTAEIRQNLDRMLESQWLPDYLKHAEPEDARAFLLKRAAWTTETAVEQTIAHELEHTAQHLGDPPDVSERIGFFLANTLRMAMNSEIVQKLAGDEIPEKIFSGFMRLVNLADRDTLREDLLEQLAENKAIELARGKNPDVMNGVLTLVINRNLIRDDATHHE